MKTCTEHDNFNEFRTTNTFYSYSLYQPLPTDVKGAFMCLINNLVCVNYVNLVLFFSPWLSDILNVHHREL